MARPCKAASLLTECSQTKEEIDSRIENENILRGKSDKILPPGELTENQKKIFEFIVHELEESKLLGNLDLFILINTCIAIDRLIGIEYKINKNPALQFRKEIISSRKNYSADFYRGCSELSLSPQSRAKLSNINLATKELKDDDVVRILQGE